jgi:hypothetical protein
LTPLAETVVWVVLSLAPNQEVRFTDLDGTKYHAFLWEKDTEFAFSNYEKGVDIRSTKPDGTMNSFVIRYTMDPFRPLRGWERSEELFDHQGRLVD